MMDAWLKPAILIALLASVTACTRAGNTSTARNLLLITIDTLRADRVGTYGYARAHTPHIDGLARSGVRFDRAFASAPITLTSHATILSGRYPPGHGARDNGIRMSASVPTLATELKARGFRTAAFVAAFPLDHQFGLDRGFDVYSDRLPRDAAGRQANERPASQVVNEAIAWLRSLQALPAPPGQPAPPVQPAPPALPALPAQGFFLWVHFFEPHAPYAADTSRPIAERYDEEIATVDREIGRLLDSVRPLLEQTLVIVAGDHGEAFGEHGEYAHSIFVYDTTLRVPLIMSGPGLERRTRGGEAAAFGEAVTLADIAPTAARLLGFAMNDADGRDLGGSIAGRESIAARELYAESFAPLVEFGWAPFRAVRSGRWKYVAAPKPELYDLDRDAAELQNIIDAHAEVAKQLSARVARYSSDALAEQTPIDADARNRLRALGYVSASQAGGNPQARPDPKDRRELAGRIAQVTSGELSGAALVAALEGILRDDPQNAQAHLRLGVIYADAGNCSRAEPHFRAALAAGLPSADAYIGLATCLGQRGDLAGARQALTEAQRLEPGSPVIMANLGILKAHEGDVAGAIEALTGALAADPNLHEARFNLALVLARAGRRADAAASARELLRRLPPAAPQRAEVERLLAALGSPKPR